MPAYSLTVKAAADVDGIFEYTFRTFGLDQARTYLAGLHAQLEELAAHPLRGRSAEELAPGLRRSEYQAHVVFFVQQPAGVRVIRVLHKRMDVQSHL